jgi:hypothetical protein
MPQADRTQFKFPSNPELSRREHNKACTESLIVFMHARMDMMKYWQMLHDKNPFKFAELFINVLGMSQVQAKEGQEIVINIMPLPSSHGPVPGVLASPLQAQIPTQSLKLVVGQPIETLEADQGD